LSQKGKIFCVSQALFGKGFALPRP